MRINVDLPAPLGPSSAMRSPRSMCRLIPLKTWVAPYALWTPLRSNTIRPLFSQVGKWKCTRFRAGGTSMGTTLSSALIRLCTCAALVAV